MSQQHVRLLLRRPSTEEPEEASDQTLSPQRLRPLLPRPPSNIEDSNCPPARSLAPEAQSLIGRQGVRPQSNRTMTPALLNQDAVYERELQRQLSMLNTYAYSGVYLDRLGPNGTGSMYRPDIISFQLNDYMAIERQQIARMRREGLLSEDPNEHHQQQLRHAQQPAMGWHRVPPTNNPLNNAGTRQLAQYQQQQSYRSPYMPRSVNSGSAPAQASFAMLPPPEPRHSASNEGTPQARPRSEHVPTPPRSSENANRSSSSDGNIPQPVTFLVPQAPQRPYAPRPIPQEPSRGMASSQDEGRWYIPPEERQRLQSPAPPAQTVRELYIPRHLRTQPQTTASRADTNPSAVSNSQSPQSRVHTHSPFQGPRRGSFVRPGPARQLYIPRHERGSGAEAQRPSAAKPQEDEGGDTEDGEGSTGTIGGGQPAGRNMGPPQRPRCTRERQKGDDEDLSDATGSGRPS